MALVAQVRRIPTPLAITIGVLVGLFIARMLPGSVSQSLFSYHMRPLELNRRFLVVFIRYLARRPRPYLPSLTTHYTPTDSYPHHRTALPCSPDSSPPFRHITQKTAPATRNRSMSNEASERCSTLVGHKTHSQSTWLGRLGLGLFNDDIDVADRRRRETLQASSSHKYFFAINLYNSFDIIPDLFATLFRVASILGYHNVFVSIYENGSTDQTPKPSFGYLTRSLGASACASQFARQCVRAGRSITASSTQPVQQCSIRTIA